MGKLTYSIRAIATIFATVAGLNGMIASASPSSVASSLSSRLTHPSASSHPPERLAQSNYWNDCRKTTQNYTQFFTNFPGGGNIGGVSILNNGSRVRLLDGGQTYSYNGQVYYRVSSPYASQNPTIGYISTNTPLDYCGPRRPMW